MGYHICKVHPSSKDSDQFIYVIQIYLKFRFLAQSSLPPGGKSSGGTAEFYFYDHISTSVRDGRDATILLQVQFTNTKAMRTGT